MPKVMLIEDDPTMLSLLGILMEMEGYGVAKINQGQDLLAGIRSEQPDLILLDVNLADANGIELLQQIRADEQLADIRIIMSSGMDYQDICMDKGANGFILKPFMPEELISMTKDIIGE